MQITVDLQDMFSYSLIPVLITGGLAMIFLIIATLMKKSKKKKAPKQEKIPKNKKPKTKNISSIKTTYINTLIDIEKKHSTNEIPDRLAYQELSLAVRAFVYKVTDIKVTNFALDEIKNLNMPKLYELIEECYTPEFAATNDCHVADSIKKVRKVIEEWN